MPKATKRERQRQNREVRREAMLAEEKRRRRFKAARNVGILFLALAAVLVLVQLTKGDDSSSDAKQASSSSITCTDKKPSAAPSTAQFSAPPPMTIDTTAPHEVVMSTSCGDIPITLDAAQAPQTVNSFLFLADQGFYDGTTFHRIVPDFVDQGGDPTASGSGGPGYSLPDEPPANGYQVGDVAMANSGSGTTGSQFFLVVSKKGAATLTSSGTPGKYSILGHMSDQGLAVAKKINSFGTTTEKPSRTIYVFSVDPKTSAADTTTTTAAP